MIEHFKGSSGTKKQSSENGINTTFKFLNSFTFSFLIFIPVLINYMIKEKEFMESFISRFIVNTIIVYIVAFGVGYIESMAECKKGSAFGYATRISSTTMILDNILFFMPPFTFFTIMLSGIPYIGTLVNGLILNISFKLAGMFMNC